MKLWIVFVLLTIVCWGAYVPTIHHGQLALGRNSALRAFLFVGLAYFLVAVLLPIALLAMRLEPVQFTRGGVTISLIAGVLGAIGAVGVILAMKNQGHPLYVAPLVFAGAPIVNTFVAMAWDKPRSPPQLLFYVGILLAAAGVALVLRYKPS